MLYKPQEKHQKKDKNFGLFPTPFPIHFYIYINAAAILLRTIDFIINLPLIFRLLSNNPVRSSGPSMQTLYIYSKSDIFNMLSPSWLLMGILLYIYQSVWQIYNQFRNISWNQQSFSSWLFLHSLPMGKRLSMLPAPRITLALQDVPWALKQELSAQLVDALQLTIPSQLLSFLVVKITTGPCANQEFVLPSMVKGWCLIPASDLPKPQPVETAAKDPAATAELAPLLGAAKSALIPPVPMIKPPLAMEPVLEICSDSLLDVARLTHSPMSAAVAMSEFAQPAPSFHNKCLPTISTLAWSKCQGSFCWPSSLYSWEATFDDYLQTKFIVKFFDIYVVWKVELVIRVDNKFCD